MHNKLAIFTEAIDIDEYRKSIKAPIYNDFKISLDNNPDENIYFYGLKIAIPIISNFISYKNGFNEEKIDSLIKEHSLKAYLLTNISDLTKMNGINALDIKIDNNNSLFFWGKDFEEFLETKEIKITYWTNPVEQISLCLLLSATFECFFDVDHHMKSLFTILHMKDEILMKHEIKRPIFDEKEYNLIEKIMPSYSSYSKDLAFCIENGKYKSKIKGYPFISRYAKTLPSGSGKYLQKAIDMMSRKTKRDFRNVFTKDKFTNQILMIAFQKKILPKDLKDGFSVFYRCYKDKPYLLNHELKYDFNSFEKAIRGFNNLTLKVTTRAIKPSLQKGIIDELINYDNNEEHIGPLVRIILGPIPKKKVILEKIEYFKGFEIKQIKSKRELVSVGKCFGNCLQTHSSYQNSLVNLENCEYFLVFNNSDSYLKNCKNFVCHFSIKNKKLTLSEMNRKGNESCSQEEYAFLLEFLIHKELTEIPEELYAHFFMHRMNQLIALTKADAISSIRKDAGLIYAILDQLSKCKNFIYPVDDQLISEGIKNQILDDLSAKHLFDSYNNTI